MWNFGFAIARLAGLTIFGIGQALLFAYATVAWFLEPDRDSVLRRRSRAWMRVARR